MQRPLETLSQIFSRERQKHWGSQEKSEVEPLHTSDNDETSKNANDPEVNLSALRSNRRWMRIPRPIMVAFYLVLEVLIVILAYEFGKQILKSRSDTLTPVPDMPQEQRLITNDPLFSLPPSPEVDSAWATLIPTERGMITVEDPQRYNLPPGLGSLNGEHIYGLTWTHQYHCLNMLRIQFWKLLRNESDLHDIGQMEDEDNETAVGHHTHCFDYLRQTLMCSMDMTVEHAARSSKTGELKGYINGLDTEHSCRSRDAVFDFMRDHAIGKGLEARL